MPTAIRDGQSLHALLLVAPRERVVPVPAGSDGRWWWTAIPQRRSTRRYAGCPPGSPAWPCTDGRATDEPPQRRFGPDGDVERFFEERVQPARAARRTVDTMALYSPIGVAGSLPSRERSTGDVAPRQRIPQSGHPPRLELGGHRIAPFPGSAKLPRSGAAVARRPDHPSPPVGAAVPGSSPTCSWVVRSGIAQSTAQNKTSSAVP